MRCPLPSTTRKNRLRIVNGSPARFQARVPDGALVLGVVQRGMQIGALVCLPDGSYIQANGDVHQRLNASQVTAALRSAQLHQTIRRSPTRSAAPVVIVKRAKRLVR